MQKGERYGGANGWNTRTGWARGRGKTLGAVSRGYDVAVGPAATNDRTLGCRVGKETGKF